MNHRFPPTFSCVLGQAAWTLLLLLLLTMPASAQIPNTLLSSIPAAPGLRQAGTKLGSSVATDGDYVVVGAPLDDNRAVDAGVVKVFSASTGALLHLIPSPSPAVNDRFGHAVAISGTRVVVGSFGDDTRSDRFFRVWVFDLTRPMPTFPAYSLVNASYQQGVSYGCAVAISGSRAVVGDYKGNRVQVYDLSGATPSVPVYSLQDPGPSSLDQFGWAVAISGTRLVVGAQNDTTYGFQSGRAYAYDLSGGTPNPPMTVLNRPYPITRDQFGHAVAISGEWAVVAPVTTGLGADFGRAFIYDLGNTTPGEPVLILEPPIIGTSPGDRFGWSLAISGTRLLVGVPLANAGALDAGRVFVYDLTSGSPMIPVSEITNPSPFTADEFGSTVAISGTNLVVGAPNDDLGGTDIGTAYVYPTGGGGPVVLNNSDPLTQQDFFGLSVAISGPLVVVGAPADDVGATNAGSAYVYDRSSVRPTVPAFTLNNPSPDPSDRFGNDVVISGRRVVVGAQNDDTGTANAGSVYVYDLDSETPGLPVITINNPEAAESALFGDALDLYGDLLVVGATQPTGGAGVVYVYDLGSGTPAVPLFTLRNPDPAISDLFGTSVGIHGTRVAVGASLDDTGGTNQGSVYVYELDSDAPTTPTLTLPNPSPEIAMGFGSSLALTDTRLVVGAPTTASAAGRICVYDLSSGTPDAPYLCFEMPPQAVGGQFGQNISISGTRLVVGMHLDNSGFPNSGTTYLYELSGATPAVPVATLYNPAPASNDQFGRSVAIDGAVVAVGAPYDDTVAADKGAAYIFGPHPQDQDSDALLDSWEELHWPGAATSHGPLDDDDRDGLVNLLELAFGMNPTVPDAGALTPLTQEGGYLTMTLTKRPGAAYEVQSAGTLTPGQPDSFSATTTTVLLDDATTLKVRDNTLTSTATARFMRVQVTGAP